MFFLIPFIPAFVGAATAAATVTAGTLALGGAGIIGAGLAGKALHDSGRKKGQEEGKAAVAAEFQAMRARLDEMEAGL